MQPLHADEPKHYLIARIREALAHDGRVNELDIDVAIVARKVFLTGDVTTPERKEAIARVVSECLPDHDVCNEVNVTQLADVDPEPLR